MTSPERWLTAAIAALLMAGISAVEADEIRQSSQAQSADAPRPNIVLILLDDVGFSDLPAYGGEARMPALDALAAGGAMFTQYRTSPLCSPSRAMLLTGIDNHRTGVATIPEVLPAEHAGQPGYVMHLEPGVITLATHLRSAGYRTYMTGKWHLGDGDGQLPVHHGFDRSFILDASGADNWAQQSYMPFYRTAPWYEDDQPAKLPETFYSPDFLTETMLGYLQTSPDQAQPFFAYLAFQAVHIPVQAPAELTAGYANVYSEGWSALQAARLQRLKALGIVPATTRAPPMPGNAREWAALSPAEQALASKAMAVHAAMLEAVDLNVGRLVSYLETTGQLANTLFIVTSDNGPEPSAPLDQPGFGAWMSWQGYTRELETLGERGSMNYIGREWALATATPGSLFKFSVSEGGIRVPMIMAGPGIASGQRVEGHAFVTDVTPTVLALAGVAPTAAPAAATTIAMTGRSLLPMLSADEGFDSPGEVAVVSAGPASAILPVDSVYADTDAIGIEVSGNAALIVGRYKLVRNLPPLGDGAWHLFDLHTDPGETRDLSAEMPERVAALEDRYNDYAARMGVLPVPEGYSSTRQIGRNTVRRVISNYAVELAGLLVLLAAGLWLLVRRVRSR